MLGANGRKWWSARPLSYFSTARVRKAVSEDESYDPRSSLANHATSRMKRMARGMSIRAAIAPNISFFCRSTFHKMASVRNVKAMLSTPRAVSRNFNPSLESFLASHGSETLLRNGVAAEDFVCTHTAFNGRPAGGNFQILHEDRDLFLRLYLQRLSVKDSGPFASTPLYLNERVIKGRPFRYYVDVDMSDATADVLFAAVADGHPLKLYRMLSDTFRRVIGDVTGEEVQECHFSRRRRGKLHFQFPTVIVDGPTAASFVAIARDSLKQLHPEFLPTQWDSIFDVGVYKSGLRMIGSRKFGHHADEDEPVYRLYDLSSGEEVPLTLEILERCMIQPHPDKDFEAVERMMESMTLEGYSSGVTLTRSVASGVRATAGIADETLERLFSYLSELRNDPKFSGRPLAAQKITRMSETIAGDGSARKRMKTSASTSSEQHAEHGFFVLLADRICPNAKREHRRKSAYLYLTVARTGTQMVSVRWTNINRPSDSFRRDATMKSAAGTLFPTLPFR